MRLMKPLIILTAFISLAQLANASSLGFGLTTYSQDTLQLGDTLRINTYLKNYDTATYASTVTFGLKINGVQNVNPNIFPNPLAGQVLNLGPGDSLQANLIVVITPAYFIVGPDILVVWPIPTDGKPARDTLTYNIHVTYPGTGIDDNGADFIRAWLINGQFNVLTEAGDINLNRVSFYSLSGQCILEAPLNGNTSIPFQSYPPGIYLAEIVYNGDQRKLVKFWK